MAVDVKTFATELARSLTKRGIPKDLAIKHAVSLVRTFDEEDLREVAAYSAPEEFEELSNSLAELIKDKETPEADLAVKSDEQKGEKEEIEEEANASSADDEDGLDKTVGAPQSFAQMRRAPKPVNRPEAAPTTVLSRADVNDTVAALPKRGGGYGKPVPVAPQPAPEADMSTRAFSIEGGEANEAANETRTFANIKTGDIAIVSEPEKEAVPAGAPASSEDEQEIYLDDDGTLPDEPKKIKLTGKGRAVFIGVCVAAFVPALLVALLVLGIFALGIVTVCAFIAAAILLLCAETVAGCGATLVGVIYGAIEIVSGSPGIGIYEIGLGIACGGAAMFFSILTYNLAVVAMPYILKQLITFEGYCLKEVGPMIGRFKGRCAGL